MKLYDVTAKEDSSLACTHSQPFWQPETLRQEQAELYPAATLEEDYFRLDGSILPFPDSPDKVGLGLWSSCQSGSDCKLSQPMKLRIDFTKAHSSVGLTLEFDEKEGDWCRYLRVRWLDEKSGTISAMDFCPKSPKEFLRHKVENWWGLELEFFETWKPYRYIKLISIDYGLLLTLGENDIIAATMLEESDMSGSSVSINTFDITLHSTRQQYSPLNPEGTFSLLQQNQMISAYGWADGKKSYMGSYYLDSWQSGEKGDIKLHSVDPVGLMDKVQFLGGIYQGVSAREILAEIFSVCQVEYRLDMMLGEKLLWGHIPVCSAREALWQTAFAIGGVVDCSRDRLVKIYPLPTRPSVMITSGRKFAGQKLRQKKAVTGIEIAVHRYTESSETGEALKTTLQSGEYTMLLNEPMHDISVQGAELIASGANYLKLRLTQAGEVTVQGKRYLDSKQLIYTPMPGVPPNTAENRLSVDRATLVSPENAGEVLERLAGYYGRSYQTELTLLLGDEKIGDMVTLKTLGGENLKGLVERMELDLTGGCVVEMTICAERMAATEFDYAGELWAGQRQGVM